jgi:hypothetical protein
VRFNNRAVSTYFFTYLLLPLTFLDPGMLSFWETESGQFSPNASAMLRIATLSAWAQLAIASTTQKHLFAVFEPLRATLIPMWIAYLRDYAIIRANSEFVNDPSVVLDSSHPSLGKEVLLPVSPSELSMAWFADNTIRSIISTPGNSFFEQLQRHWKSAILSSWLRCAVTNP